MPPTGEGRRGVLIVAEAPGAEEDKRGTQLVGASGQLLRSVLEELGVSLDRDCWKTNALICRPPDNRTPTANEIDYCRPNVFRAVKDYSPSIIILLGKEALRSVVGTRWAGWRIPHQRTNMWVCPTYHPAAVLRAEKQPVMKVWWRRHLKAAFELAGKPWPDGPPDYAARVRRIYNADEAAYYIDQTIAAGGPIAFDYETNMLKPDSHQAAVITCSVCWRGRRTFAYPWAGAAVAATQRLLRSPLPKFGSNIKFEDRWTRCVFGHPVRNWYWDTMLGAHVEDNRRNISSIKFQAFVKLGLEPYDGHIKPFFKSKSKRTPNRIKEIDIQDLLLYNGIDSLVEYEVAMLQMRAMGYPLPE
jgi:uracil-DNA glycosylase family 4